MSNKLVRLKAVTLLLFEPICCPQASVLYETRLWQVSFEL